VSSTFVLLLAYSALQVGLGLWIGRRVRVNEDFFVAGRRLPAGLIFATFLAANIGAGSTVGAASLAYREGASAWWWNGSAGLGCLALAFTVGPRLWRESAAHGDLSVGDFLERRYGRLLRLLTASLIWVGTLHILAAQLLGIATVVTAVAGLSTLAGCLVGAAIATTYFAAGGLVSTAWVNVLQLTVKLCGFLIVTPLALAAAGGWHALPSEGSRLDLFASAGPLSGWRLLFALGPAFIVSPGLIQKAYGARSARTLSAGVAANGAALLAFGVIPVILGSSARALFPSLANPDLALARLAATAVPPAAGALALAAIFSAELSAADAVLLMLATSGSRDLYLGFVKRSATPAEVLRVARLAAVGGAVAGVALALAYQSIAGVLGLFYSLLTATLFVPIVGGVYVPSAGRIEGLASVVAGVATLAIVHVATGGIGIGFVPPALAGVLASALAFAVARVSGRVR
jgi:solute:Na+ symporter, SSS family